MAKVPKYRRPKDIAPGDAYSMHEVLSVVRDFVSLTVTDYQTKWNRPARWDVLMHEVQDLLEEINRREESPTK